MRNPIAFLVIGLFFGTGIGFLWAASQGITLDGHDHATGHGATGAHDHSAMQALSVADDGTAPTLGAVLHPDSVSGFNLELTTQNFTFTPDAVNAADTPNTGHAHIYVDGVKRARLYGNWFHLDDLTPGDHVIAVELNANSHSPIHVNGQPVRVELQVNAP
ncbi:hypothetical protein [Neptunicoccus sediminis]|uniref:hypothetical protein n=1 Tax=Neptunicoccus sediminis TaxID=1892596 RepID=UPI0008461DA4|nr:hypothetical protein [Neptunicoccus sediminis]